MYTDGSKIGDKAGAGFAYFRDTTCIGRGSFRVSNYATVFHAEILAIKKAAEFVIDSPVGLLDNKHIKIYSDSRVALLALKSRRDL